jgi:hypothetical protein
MKQPKESSVVILGPARNVARNIEASHRRLSKAFQDFHDVHFIYLEGLSQDSTWEKLQVIALRESAVELIKHEDYSELKLSRPERIGIARNILLDHVKVNHPSADYVVMTDLDEVNRGISRKSVLSNFSHTGWAAMTANQPGGYYDIFALRHPYWNDGDCWQAQRALEPEFGSKLADYLAVKSKCIKIPKYLKPIPVQSAFGGIAIYHFEYLKNATYSGLDAFGHETCEHIPLNQLIIEQGGSIFINPAFVNMNPYRQFIANKSAWVRRGFRGKNS